MVVHRRSWTNEDEYAFWADRDLAQDYQDYLDALGLDEEEGLGSSWEDEIDE